MTHRFARVPTAFVAAAVLAGCVVAPVPGTRYRRDAPPPPLAQPAPPTMYFYPTRGQPEVLQERDRYECYRWAVGQVGFDPGMTPVRQPRVASVPPPPPAGADVVAGAATGAVLGAAVSSPRHAGEGAVIGAIFGAIAGAASNEARQRAAEAAQARQAAAAERGMQPLGPFRRAMTACMDGRGYRVQ
jgi:hypothetical protein